MVLEMRRRLAARLGHAKLCRRKVCRRAGVCSGPECLVDRPPPVEETPSGRAALRRLYDQLKASVATAEETS
jgi:hypothetical protein